MLFQKGLSINDVTHSGGGGSSKSLVYYSKMRDKGQGVRKQIFHGGARRNEKCISCKISKILLHKSKKDGGAQAHWAPPVPHPLQKTIITVKVEL